MSAKFDRLWAKSRGADEPFRPSMLLIGHLQDVYASAQRVLDATATDQLRALGLDPGTYLERFRRCVLLAAAVHDLGKANDHFLGMLNRTRDVRTNPQGIRHEWVTILLLRALKPWLLPAVDGSEPDFAIVEWAIAGHHPGPTHESPPRACPRDGGVELTTFLGHPDAKDIFDWIAGALPVAAEGRPTGRDVTWQLAGWRSAFTEIKTRWAAAAILWDQLRHTDAAKLVAAVKDCLIAADIAGSALPKALPDDPRRWEWITRAFDSRPEPGDIWQVAVAGLEGHPPRRFQMEVAASDRMVTFVRAGCGSGKTIAAYMWAAVNHPTRRLYFCYPTTGTATEGYRDYLFDPERKLGRLGARLFHSRRDIDFDVILASGPGEEDTTAARLESVEAWSTPIAACTVDTVLGVTENHRRGLFGWPALAQSAFVFDEIHSYDAGLFEALLRFLVDLPGLPVLLMTASLPKPREEALRRTLAGRGIDLAPIAGPAELECRPRYHRSAVATVDDAVEAVAKELADGGKVLWVCNTVARVIDTADRAAARGLTSLIYHSHFRYLDRVERHRDVVAAFTRTHVGAALAVCSQVAEMSLDLEGCTLLVTDLARIAAMIQRLGRLNRQAKAGDPTRPFIVIEPDGPLPYKGDELAAARQWLGKLPAGAVQQRDLADCWEQTIADVPKAGDSAWLDGGPVTVVRELRDVTPGISVLLREDVDGPLEGARGRAADVGRYVVPMNPPRGVRWQDWEQYKGIPIAEPLYIDYDRKRGGQWSQSNSSPVRFG